MPKSSYREDEVVRLIGDGAIATDTVHGGRMVVVLILDCMARPEITDLIRLHAVQPLGDVVSTWARSGTKGAEVALHLQFLRPTPGEILIVFDLPRLQFVVDSIIQNHACYIQSSVHGKRLSEAMNAVPRVMLEIPSESLPFDWDKEIHKSIYDQMRREGLGRAEAKLAAKNSIKMSRDLYRFRAPGGLFARPL